MLSLNRIINDRIQLENIKENTSVYRDAMVAVFISYLKSKQWKEIKNIIYKKYNWECTKCLKPISAKTSICHHLSYENWGKGNYEEILDCILLCRKCHANLHSKNINTIIDPFWASRNYDSKIIKLKDLYLSEI